MSKRAVSGITSTLLFIGIVTLAFAIQPAEASETIYIRSDGSVDPVTAPIQRVNNVYTVTDDIHNKSIIIQKDNITLDGNGHLLQGPTIEPTLAYGIYLPFRKNVTITDFKISHGFTYVIFLDGSTNCKIISNHIQGIDCKYGVKLFESNYNFLTGNTIMNTYTAIELEGAGYNTLSNNNIRNNTNGIWLYSLFTSPSTGNTLRNNVMTSNKYSFHVYSHFSMSGYINDVDTSNTVDGKPIYYWINRHDETIPQNAGCVIIVNSSKIRVRNLRLRNTGTGVCLAYTTNSHIENVNSTKNFCPFWVHKCDSNVITRNNITDNEGAGIFLHKSNYNSLTDNYVRNSNSSGIWLEDCCYPGYNTLIGNTVLYSRLKHAGQEWDGAGILVDDSSNCQVINNNLTRNSYGIVVAATPASNNQLIGNNIVMNDVGLLLGDARYNAIYHNNFVENTLQFDKFWNPSHNTFDDGYPSGGNYWSNYEGVDVKKGAGQSQPGSDSIGDTPYTVYDNNLDRYPLMHPFGTIPPPTYSLTIEAAANGITEPEAGTYLYTEGQNVSVKATPYRGFMLCYWELDGADVGAANPISISMEHNHTLRAFFVQAYSLVITATAGGTTNPPPETYTHAAGTVANITAVPNAGYYFERWELDSINASTNPISITINSDLTLKAVFAHIEYTLTITATVGGTTNPPPDVYVEFAGTSVDVTALPDSGCYLDHWLLDDVNIGVADAVNVVMDINHTLHAVFEQLSVGHDVAVKWMKSKTVVGQGYPLTVKVTATNVGSYTETFNVTLYANATAIDTMANVTLTSGQSITITFTWNTTEFGKGNCTLGAYAHPVPNETNLLDNNFTGGWVIIAIPGDLTGGSADPWDFVPDGLVDGADIIVASRCYGSWPEATSPLIWHPNCDINNDNVIDGSDLIIVSRSYGETDP